MFDFQWDNVWISVIRSIASVAVLYVITKIMGYRQISQLSFYDYIIGISIGSISADMATDLEMNLQNTLVPLIVYGGFSVFLSYLTLKSIKCRRVFTGRPIVLVENGKLNKENFKKAKCDLNDFLASCRQAGYFNISDINFAIMEHTGNISVLPFPQNRPATPADLNIQTQPESLVANVIIDGCVMSEHLKLIGRDEIWLKKQLAQQNISSPDQVLLATCDANGQFHAYLPHKPLQPYNVLD